MIAEKVFNTALAIRSRIAGGQPLDFQTADVVCCVLDGIALQIATLEGQEIAPSQHQTNEFRILQELDDALRRARIPRAPATDRWDNLCLLRSASRDQSEGGAA